MSLEQEEASIIKFVLDKSGLTNVYYKSVPEGFAVPSVYFPIPRLDGTFDTVTRCRVTCQWDVKFFHKTTEEAYAIASKVFRAICEVRFAVPCIDENGNSVDMWVRLDSPLLQELDNGAVALKLKWIARHPFPVEAVTKATAFHISGWSDEEPEE